MKKLVIGIFACISFISYMIVQDTISSRFIDDLINFTSFQKESVTFLVYQDNNLDAFAFISDMRNIGDKDHTSIVKIASSKNGDYYDLYLHMQNRNLLSDIGLHMSEKQMYEFNHDDQFYEKNSTSFRIFPSTEFNIHNFKNHDLFEYGGVYQFIGKHANQSLATLKEKYKDLHTETMKVDATNHLSIFNTPRMIPFLQLLALLLAIASICMLMDHSQKEKNIVIRKIHGWSNIRILIQINKKFLFTNAFISLSIYSICFLLNIDQINKYTWLMIISLLLLIILEIAMLLFIFIFLYFFLKGLTMIDLLKNKKRFKNILSINFVIRIFIVLYGVSLVGEYFPTLQTDLQQVVMATPYLEQISGFKHFDNYHTLESDPIAFMDDLYARLNHEGGIGIETLNYHSSYEFIPFLTANINYINHYQIKDINNSPLRLEEGKQYILVPAFVYKDHIDLIKKEFPQQIDYEIIPIYDHQKFFTFDNTVLEKGIGYAYDPVVVVSNFINPWFVYFKENSTFAANILQNLKSKGYTADLDYTKISEDFSVSYRMTRDRLLNQLIIMIIMIIALCFTITQLVLAYMESNQKEIAIKRLNGYSLIRRYDSLFLLQTLFYFIVSSYCFLWGKSTIEFITLMMMFLFEFVLTAAFILLRERKTILNSLKE